MTFEALGLSAPILQALQMAGYDNPTTVQEQAIPVALEGRDLMVSSSTGSGKTAAFALPALEKILKAREADGGRLRRDRNVVYGPRVVVLVPTRELAIQVSKACVTYGKKIQGLKVATVVGGVPYGAQIKFLRSPLDILISTPGRLLDHLGSGNAVLDNVEMLVLDEADRMLDMGFIDDIRQVASHLPEERQTVMFSATFAGHVGHLAQQLTRDAQRIDVASHTDTHANITQRMHWADNLTHKNSLLESILSDANIDQAVIFTSTQRDADWLSDHLADMGHAVAALHGGMPQGRRNRVLQGLRFRQLRVLVATDVAARGIDVPTITHVINYGLPMKPEDYVHRIGRTGRAGRDGLAITLAERRDQGMIRRIERFTTQRIPAETIAGLEPKLPAPVDRKKPEGWRPGQGRGDGKGFRGGNKRFGGGFGGGFGGRDRDSFGGGDRSDRFDGQARDFGDRQERGDRPNRDSFGDRRQDSGWQARGGADRGGDQRQDRSRRSFEYGDRQDKRPSGRREEGGFPFAKPEGDSQAPREQRFNDFDRKPQRGGASFDGGRRGEGQKKSFGKPFDKFSKNDGGQRFGKGRSEGGFSEKRREGKSFGQKRFQD